MPFLQLDLTRSLKIFELKNYKIMPNFIIEKIINDNFDNVDIVEHLVYKEYE